MSSPRVFPSSAFLMPTDDEPIRSVVTESAHAVVVAWYIQAGQQVLPHIHPQGQDTWTILQGQGQYYLDPSGTQQPIVAGDIVVAPMGCTHGVLNDDDQPLIFISVVTPADAGYQLASAVDASVSETIT
ncbi:MAG: cupin domain-containing protein [Thermosynechococcaceae cyanobacterium]